MPTPLQPPVAGMTLEAWTSLLESRPVRPQVVTRVRAALAAGERVTSYAVAVAMTSELYRYVASRS